MDPAICQHCKRELVTALGVQSARFIRQVKVRSRAEPQVGGRGPPLENAPGLRESVWNTSGSFLPRQTGLKYS